MRYVFIWVFPDFLDTLYVIIRSKNISNSRPMIQENQGKFQNN
jgi:hypothetical protein